MSTKILYCLRETKGKFGPMASGAIYSPQFNKVRVYDADVEGMIATGLFFEQPPAEPKPTPLPKGVPAMLPPKKLPATTAGLPIFKDELVPEVDGEKEPEPEPEIPFDFTSLTGVGPARQQSLLTAGIDTLGKLIALTPTELADKLDIAIVAAEKILGAAIVASQQ